MVHKVKSVLVTGGSGFIGLHLVYELLKAGYKVHATTRNINNAVALPLKLLRDEHRDFLTLFEADLLVSGSFEKAMYEVEAVFHVATPVLYGKAQDNPDLQIKPALNGTVDILNSCTKFPEIKTIIITSSCITASNFANEKDEYSELDFNPIVGSEMEAYIRAKTLAERATWDFHKFYKNRFRVVTIHPSIVLGPDCKIKNTVSNRSNIGKEFLLMIIRGVNLDCFPDATAVVDVRDVAIGHIKAFENNQATGRFLLNSQSLSKQSVLDFAYKYFPKKINQNGIKLYQSKLRSVAYSNTRSISILKIKYRPIEETIRDALSQIHNEYRE